MKLIARAFLGLVAIAISVETVYGISIEQYFSPQENILAVYHSELTKAKTSVKCSLYSMTNTTLTKDLQDLLANKVLIQIGLDKVLAAKYSVQWKALQAAGAEIRLKKTGTPEHNKYCIIDEKVVLSGSWNWSNSAQSQDNVGSVMKDSDIAGSYLKAFNHIWERDKPSDSPLSK